MDEYSVMLMDTVLALVVASVVYLVLWLLVGRDPRSRPVPSQNTPPPGVSAAGARYLLLGRYDPRALAACILALAEKGLLEFHQYQRNLSLERCDGDYPEEPLPNQIANLEDELPPDQRFTPEEIATAEGLFNRYATLAIDPRHRGSIRTATAGLRKALREQYLGAFICDNWPYQMAGLLVSIVLMVAVGVHASQSGAGGAVALVAVMLMAAQVTAPVWMSATRPLYRAIVSPVAGPMLRLLACSIILAMVLAICFFLVQFLRLTPQPLFVLLVGMAGINMLFQYLLRAHTPRGRQALDELHSFRRFLAGEARDVPWPDGLHQPTLELFTRYLPYAVALDVTAGWLRHCAVALHRPDGENPWRQPAWFRGDVIMTHGYGGFLAVIDTEFLDAIRHALTGPALNADPLPGGDPFPPVM